MPGRVHGQGSMPRSAVPRSTHGNGLAAVDHAFPIVGLGASAGGLDAFQRFLDAMPADGGMAFVLIQHLDPKHESLMADLLAAHTSMPVLQALDGMAVEADHVYLIPPGAYLALDGLILRLSTPLERHGARLPFDFFLHSLASACGDRACCVILSGTGADGSAGLTSIRERGGLVIVQDPVDAAFAGMPRNAIATGKADLIMAIDQMPRSLMDHRARTLSATSHARGAAPALLDESLAAIIALLAAHSSFDFSLYKKGTLRRRIERRMTLITVADGDGYLRALEDDAGERALLAHDLLINVTQFFRDPTVFDFLSMPIIAELVAAHSGGRPLRVWVPGCSTGEEAYSIAMLFLEEIERAGRAIKLQVFASDIDSECVAFARNGIYHTTIEAHVTPARLARFFVRDDNKYQVTRDLGETVVFTKQNLLIDPPFSRIDFVSCRNLMIYLSPEAQQKVLSLFQFALREGGMLLLGLSETTGGNHDQFEPINKKFRVYRNIARNERDDVAFVKQSNEGPRSLIKSTIQQPPPRRVSMTERAQSALLRAYAPTSVLINAKREGLHYSGSIDRYLKITAGEAIRDILALVREGLRAKLRAAIQGAARDGVRIAMTGAQIQEHDGTTRVTITVWPVAGDQEQLFLVCFEDEAAVAPGAPSGASTVNEPPADTIRVVQLEQELEATRADLHNATRELEIAVEEHKVVNEEAMSANEEFQSTNEELETSKEELQSLNEELTALNSQLHETVEHQRATANDLKHILDSTDMATVFLDVDFNIRFFTPAARTLFNIITSDVGRPLSDFTRRFEDVDLMADARSVLATQTSLTREIRATDGRWFKRRMLPYLGDKNAIDGVVMTFANISELKTAEHDIEAARAYLDSIIATIRQPLLILDEEMRIISASSSFNRMFSIPSDHVTGKNLLAVAPYLDMPPVREFLASIQAAEIAINDHELQLTLPSEGLRIFQISARVIQSTSSAKRKILLAFVDTTETKRESDALVAAKSEAERANAAKSRFLAAASHDLRQPLQTISLLQGLMEKRAHDDATRKLALRLDETVTTMAEMLDKLLDINQLEAGIVQPKTVDFPVQGLLDEMLIEFNDLAADRGLRLRVLPSTLEVHSDPALLKQIIRNLLANAVKYTTRGKILLGCRRRGSTVRIGVWDTGSGIPYNELQAIFEEFHQIDNPARQRSKGLGLGLAIVKRVAGLLDHNLEVHSRHGVGSGFSVDVARVAATSGGASSTSATLIRPGPPEDRTILIIEDDPVVREMLQLLFESKGHKTLEAADGDSAIAMITNSGNAPNLIIADFNLPNGLTGLQTIARIQAGFHTVIPAVILTGDISTASLREITGHGCVYLNKPVKARELAALAERLLVPFAHIVATDDQSDPMDRGGSTAAGMPRVTSEAVRPRAPAAAGLTVFVVDDDRAIRESIRDLLHAEGFGVETYADGPAFLAAYRADDPGCLLVDANMPGMSGVDLIRRLGENGHAIPAIVITGSGAISIAVEAMKAGAVDFIEKPVGADELLASITRAFELTSDNAAHMARREAATKRVASLTRRQQEILTRVLAGEPSKNIAADLGISQRTVDNHRAAIMKKTGSKSMPALVRTALAAG